MPFPYPTSEAPTSKSSRQTLPSGRFRYSDLKEAALPEELTMGFLYRKSFGETGSGPRNGHAGTQPSLSQGDCGWLRDAEARSVTRGLQVRGASGHTCWSMGFVRG
jgi:hypothetical protein